MPALVDHELAGKTDIQQVNTRQALDAGRLQDNGFRVLVQPGGENSLRLERKARIVLETDAGPDLPRPLPGTARR